MWQGGSQAGGFLDNSQFDSPSENKKDTTKKSQNLICASVQQILSSPSDSLQIGRVDVNLLRLVARVKSVEKSSTKNKYELEDDTGTITAISWLDGDADETDKCSLVEGTYCRVVGSVRSQEGRRYIMLLQAEPVHDANQLTAHLLGVIHNELMANKSPNDMAPGQANGNISGMAGGSGMAATVKTEAVGGPNDKVLQFINGFNHMDSGVNKGEIVKNFSGQMSARQIDEALEFLCNEGQIYTTLDDDHYKSTEV